MQVQSRWAIAFAIAWMGVGCAGEGVAPNAADLPIAGTSPLSAGTGMMMAGQGSQPGASGNGSQVTAGHGAGGTMSMAQSGSSAPLAGMNGAAGMQALAGMMGDDGSDDPAVPPGALDPIIPEATGDCPELMSGTQTIMGTSVEIVSGAAAATKGPMLFTWHGTGGTGSGALRQLPQSVQDDIVSQGGLVIAPSANGQLREGTDVTFVLGVWYDIADLKLADLLVACAVKNHNIDPRKIYVTGCSAGGLMAGVMALERSAYVAAAAPNSGGVVIAETFPLQDPMRVPAVMTMNGGVNDNVIVNFNDTSKLLDDTITAAGGFVVECNHMIGHCAAPPELHENAWEFMKAHPFGVGASPYESGLPASFPDYCTVL